MYKEVFPRAKLERGDRIADRDGQLRLFTAHALYRLLKARTYADDTGRNAWDFAVTLGELRRDGATENELRWLVCRGYIDHATELITQTGGDRTFEHNVSLRFCRETAFVITGAGKTFARELLKQFERPNADIDIVDDAKSFVLATQRIVPKPADQSRPKSNGLSPKWDRDRRELRLGSQLVKVFKLPSPMQEAIFMAFEEEGWPPRIDDPLPSHPDLLPKRRLHDTIKSLNRNQKNPLIRFMGDGTGEGIRWELNRIGDAEHSKPRAH
jgi:hypothetical protein